MRRYVEDEEYVCIWEASHLLCHVWVRLKLSLKIRECPFMLWQTCECVQISHKVQEINFTWYLTLLSFCLDVVLTYLTNSFFSVQIFLPYYAKLKETKKSYYLTTERAIHSCTKLNCNLLRFHLKEKNVNLFVVPKERPGGYQDQ